MFYSPILLKNLFTMFVPFRARILHFSILFNKKHVHPSQLESPFSPSKIPPLPWFSRSPFSGPMCWIRWNDKPICPRQKAKVKTGGRIFKANVTWSRMRRLPTRRCFSKQRSLLWALCFYNVVQCLSAERLLQVISSQVPLVLKNPCGDWAGECVFFSFGYVIVQYSRPPNRSGFPLTFLGAYLPCSCFVASPFLPHSVPQVLWSAFPGHCLLYKVIRWVVVWFVFLMSL